MANIGRWISPNGVDVTNSTILPFEVTVGGEQDPGSLLIHQRNGHILTRSFQGIYTCLVPNADGVEQYLSIGIYENGFNSMLPLAAAIENHSTLPSLTAPLSILSLDITSDSSTAFTLNCTSSGSPAAMVTWMKYLNQAASTKWLKSCIVESQPLTLTCWRSMLVHILL